jgi:hypothetical protein
LCSEVALAKTTAGRGSLAIMADTAANMPARIPETASEPSIIEFIFPLHPLEVFALV